MSNLTGTDKSVILLMTIGEDRAAEVFKHLSQRESANPERCNGERHADLQQAANRCAGGV